MSEKVVKQKTKIATSGSVSGIESLINECFSSIHYEVDADTLKVNNEYLEARGHVVKVEVTTATRKGLKQYIAWYVH